MRVGLIIPPPEILGKFIGIIHVGKYLWVSYFERSKHFLCISLFISWFSVGKWKKHRRVIASIFSSKFLDQLYPIFNENNRKLVEKISKHVGESQPFDIWDYIISCNLNNVSRKYWINIRRSWQSYNRIVWRPCCIIEAAMGYNLNDKRTLSEFVYAMKK